MQYGLNCSWALGTSPTPDDYVRLAQMAEKRGFNSFWIGDHVAEPARFDASKYPYSTGFGQNAMWHDPFVFLSAIAMATRSIQLGTGVAVVPYRHPMLQAQAIATLDYLSGGRFRFGIGVGWMEEEFAMLGVPFSQRGARTNEYLGMMQQLWAGDSSPFAGHFHAHDGARMKPLPTQRPHPPIIVGGEGEPAFRRAAILGNGLLNFYKSPPAFRDDLTLLADILSEQGRTVDDMYIMMVVGDPDALLENMEEIPELEALSVRELVLVPILPTPAAGFEWLAKTADRLFSGKEQI